MCSTKMQRRPPLCHHHGRSDGEECFAHVSFYKNSDICCTVAQACKGLSFVPCSLQLHLVFFVPCCANIAKAISLCPAVHCAQLCWALSCCAKITDRRMYSVQPRKENSIATTTTTTTKTYKQTKGQTKKGERRYKLLYIDVAPGECCGFTRSC